MVYSRVARVDLSVGRFYFSIEKQRVEPLLVPNNLERTRHFTRHSRTKGAENKKHRI